MAAWRAGNRAATSEDAAADRYADRILAEAPATPAPVVPSAVREDTFAALAKGLAEAVHRTIDGDRGAWKTVFEFTRAIEQVTEGYALDPRAALEEVLRG